jgi:hypothetical protein
MDNVSKVFELVSDIREIVRFSILVPIGDWTDEQSDFFWNASSLLTKQSLASEKL